MVEANSYTKTTDKIKKSPETMEIIQLNKEIEMLEAEVQQNEEKKKKIHMVTD